MKKIPLSQGKVALVDDKDYEYLCQWKWFAYKHRNTFYAARNLKPVNGKRNQIRMHAEIIGRKEGLEIDHRNGNGLDNRQINLRHVTNRQNCQNRHTEQSSKYPGVYWFKSAHKWMAQIRVNGKKKGLGYFINEADAFKAYCNAVNEIGEAVL